MQIMQKYKIKC